MAHGVVLGENDVVGIVRIALEVTHLGEATPAILGETVRPYEPTAVITRRVIGATRQVENQQRFPGFSSCRSGVRICVQELVVRRIVRHQYGRPEVDRLSPEEAHVRFHLVVLVGVGWGGRARHGALENKVVERVGGVVKEMTTRTVRVAREDLNGNTAGCALIWVNVGTTVGVAAIQMLAGIAVERRVESVPDQGRIADAQPWYTRSKRRWRTASRRTVRSRQSPTSRPILVGIAAQDAVGRIHQLVGQRCHARLQQFLADLGPVAAIKRHFKLAQRRPLGQGTQAGELDELAGCRQPAALIHPHVGLRVGRAEHAAAIVVVAGATVPEVIEVHVRQDDGGSIARLDSAELSNSAERACTLEAWKRVDVVRRERAALIADQGSHAVRGRAE